VTSIGHRLRIVGRKYKIDDFPVHVLIPGGDVPTYEHAIAHLANPALVFRRRVLLPVTRTLSIPTMCQLTGFALPGPIAVCGCWNPIAETTDEVTEIFHPKLIGMAFDHLGRFVTAIGVDSRFFEVFSPELALGGKMKDIAHGKFDASVGFLRSPYYVAQRTFELDLSGLPMGVCSIAFAILPVSNHLLHMFKRKAVRIVNLANGAELGVGHIHAENRSRKWGMLIGGLAYAQDIWHWIPSAQMLKFERPENVVMLASLVWYQRLSQFELLVG
jgi:hypothetical protein